MSTTRRIVVFIAVAALGAALGVYSAYLWLQAVFTAKQMIWGDFLQAEFGFLLAGGYLRLTRIHLAVRRGIIRREQVRRKAGLTVRVSCMIAAMLVGFAYVVTDMCFISTPWWFRHLCGSLIAVLMFCAFTYPWTRRMTPSIGRMKIWIPLFALSFLCGCVHQRFSAGHSDVGQFVLQTAVQFGGTPKATNGFPTARSRWGGTRDRNVPRTRGQECPRYIKI